LIIEIIERIIESSGYASRHFVCTSSVTMSQADQLQVRTDAFADLSIRFVRSTSAASNYRAARRARSYNEFLAKLGIVSEEADESVLWLRRQMNAKLRSSTVELGTLLSEAEQLARIFGVSHRTAKRRKRR
jgi:four helix bundle protein